ncbi:Kinesin-like protein KIF23 [Smittium mucronatum]|uniref:Kinesin-like protein KIF23 n=1 Tax=Smittium mucronatum TaxID=133383 RepID=A0A1R0GLA6_9FUNG|nr:Kinesin-like protein KIF23 [Smittium mucronatum]
MVRKNPVGKKKNLKRNLETDQKNDSSKKITRTYTLSSRSSSSAGSGTEDSLLNKLKKSTSELGFDSGSDRQIRTRFSAKESLSNSSSGSEFGVDKDPNSASLGYNNNNSAIFNSKILTKKKGGFPRGRVVPKGTSSKISNFPPINKFQKNSGSSINNSTASDSENLSNSDLVPPSSYNLFNNDSKPRADSVSSVGSSSTVLGNLVAGVTSFFSPKKGLQRFSRDEKGFQNTPRNARQPKLSGTNDIMQIPVSKTPFTNRKTIAEYNDLQDPIETYLRLKTDVSLSDGLDFSDSSRVPSTSRQRNKIHDTEMKVLSDKEIEIAKNNSDNHTIREKYLFAGVLTNNTDSRVVYEKTAGVAVSNLFKGKNSLLFAYGVTGSGKTFTMQGNPENPGLIVRALCDIVLKVQKLNDRNKKRSNVNPEGVIKDGFSLRPKFSNQAEWCMDPRIISSNISPITGEDQWSDFIDSINQKLDNEHSDDLQDDFYNSDSSDSDNPIISDPWKYSLFLSYYEVYNENVYDLLDLPTISLTSTEVKPIKRLPGRPPNSKNHNNHVFDQENTNSSTERRPLQLRSENGKGANTFIEGITEVRVETVRDAIRVLLHGQEKRSVFSTSLNSASSRSHALCNARILKWKDAPDLIPNNPIPESASVSISSLLLVDLAGSERAKYTNNTGERLLESSKINVSLMSLKRCMDVLRYNSGQPKDMWQIVPFNESKLTRLFQPALEGGSKTVMIACVDPRQLSGPKNNIGRSETINVLEFARVASTVLLSNKKNKRYTQDANSFPGFMSPTISKGKRLFESTIKKNEASERPSSSLRELNNNSRAKNQLENNNNNRKMNIVYDNISEDDSHIDLFQLIKATKSARSSIINSENNDQNNSSPLVSGVKRTIDAEVQTDYFEFISAENSKTIKKQKVDLYGNWRRINYEDVFKDVKKDPSRRRSFPNIPDIIGVSEISYLPPNNVVEPNNSKPNSKWVKIPQNYVRTQVLKIQSKIEKENEQNELDYLRLIVLNKDSKISKAQNEINETKSEFEAMTSYAKELRAALDDAKKEILEVKKESILTDTQIRQSLTEFHGTQIRDAFNKFNAQQEKDRERAEEKSSKKVDLLLGVFSNALVARDVNVISTQVQKSEPSLLLDNSTNNIIRNVSNVSPQVLEYEYKCASLEKELEKTKVLLKQLEDKNIKTLSERDLLLKKLDQANSEIKVSVDSQSSFTFMPSKSISNVENEGKSLKNENFVLFDGIKPSDYELLNHKSNFIIPDLQKNSVNSTFSQKVNALEPNKHSTQSPEKFIPNLTVKKISKTGKIIDSLPKSFSLSKFGVKLFEANCEEKTKKMNSFKEADPILITEEDEPYLKNSDATNKVMNKSVAGSFIENTIKELDKITYSKNGFQADSHLSVINESKAFSDNINDDPNNEFFVSLFPGNIPNTSSQTEMAKTNSSTPKTRIQESSSKKYKFSPEENLVLKPNINPSFHNSHTFSDAQLEYKSNNSMNKKPIAEYPDLFKKLQSDLDEINMKGHAINKNTQFAKNFITKPSTTKVASTKNVMTNPLPKLSSGSNFGKKSSNNNLLDTNGQRSHVVSPRYQTDSVLNAIYVSDNEMEISSFSRSSSLRKNNENYLVSSPTRKNISVPHKRSPSMPSNQSPINLTNAAQKGKYYNSSGSLIGGTNVPKVVGSPISNTETKLDQSLNSVSPLENMPGSISSHSNNGSNFTNGNATYSNSDVGRKMRPQEIPKTPSNSIAKSFLSSVFNFTAGISSSQNVENKVSDATLNSNSISPQPSKTQIADKKQKIKRKSKGKINKNDGFMLSPLRIFYKLRSRK